jgi:GTP pyrophosphokinase
MNEIAEHGLAAHWKYKEGEEYTEDEGELNNWLKTIREILDSPHPDAMDFLDSIKMNLFASEIFVFTPKGDIKTMPAGCTALDFAFSIHTDLGSHCIGAKVNHKLVPLSHKLNSGDQVDIITSKSQHVQPSWINFVTTAKARAKIQSIIRHENRKIEKKGEEILTNWLKEQGKEITTSIIDRLSDLHELQRPDTFFLALGNHTIILGDADLDELNGKNVNRKGAKGWRRYVPFLKSKKDENNVQRTEQLSIGKDFNKKKPVIVNEQTINQLIFPDCCHPIPGDDILGFIDNRNHIEIHNRSCSVANKLKASFGPRIIDAKWDMHRVLFFDATIEIQGTDRTGLLLDIAQVISNQFGVNIHQLTIKTDEGIFDGKIELRVHDRNDVNVIIENLKKIGSLQEVQQI